MRASRARKSIMMAVFGCAILLGGCLAGATPAQAQGRHRGWVRQQHNNLGRNGWDRNRGRRFNSIRPRVFIVPRVVPRGYSYPRFYPYYSPYRGTYYGGSYYLGSEQQGYHDGLDRGREDARDGRTYNPNNSSHYRNSSGAAYRDGFRRGYDVGYSEYRGYRRW